MDQQLRVFPLEKDLGLVPSIHVGWLIMACNNNFSGSDTLFWPSSVHIPACAYTQTYTQVHIHSHKIYLREKKSQIKMYCYGSKGEI